ncbi:uncharacterized protein LOC119389310 [Rhipicephalus sanguineus]|uniref:uncharacterized protein LOC119389310 n=1 Tax=Rhipicephalus sanguineus TaxID=34632 RepID=UPI0018939091|nr:uncharacterized protein LOC119389310 [Rhipicephalus sanguineus]
MAATYASMLKFCLLTAILIAGSRSEESDKEDASAHKYNIRLANGTSFEITTHGFQEFSKVPIATAGVNAMMPTANQLVHRFQEDLKNIQNVTRSLPRTDVARLTEQTRGNLTLLVRNLTGALPMLMRRMATQGAESTRPLREFATALSHNLRNASLALSNSGNASGNSTGSTLPTASHDLLQAYDGFQLAVNNGMLAMSDLVRGSLKLVNPANWNVGRVGLGAGDGQTPQAGINKFIGHLFRRRG